MGRRRFPFGGPTDYAGRHWAEQLPPEHHPAGRDDGFLRWGDVDQFELRGTGDPAPVLVVDKNSTTISIGRPLVWQLLLQANTDPARLSDPTTNITVDFIVQLGVGSAVSFLLRRITLSQAFPAGDTSLVLPAQKLIVGVRTTLVEPPVTADVVPMTVASLACPYSWKGA